MGRYDFFKPDKTEGEERIRQESLAVIDKLRAEGIQDQVLPIEQYKESFLDALRGGDTVMVVGDTGSGKSLETGWWTAKFLAQELGRSPRVAMLEPTRDATQFAAIGMAARHGACFGKDVCFSTSEFHGNERETVLQVQTTQMLVHQCRRDPLLSHLDAVVIDEAHRRDVLTDFAAGLIKIANERRLEGGMKPLKVVVVSATLDEDKFGNHFSIAPHARIRSEGRMFPVRKSFIMEEEKYRGEGEQKQERVYTELAAEAVEKILQGSKSGDILVFLPGRQSIRSVEGMLLKKGVRADIRLLYRGVSQENRAETVSPKKGARRRRVILATDIAETSVTVPGIKWVIDSGRKREMVFDPETGLERLTDVFVSKANAEQRAGRSGRTDSGEYVSLLTQEEQRALEEHSTPEMLRRSISKMVLEMIALGISDVENFPYIDTPPERNLREAIAELEMLGAIDGQRNLTEMGKVMAKLPMEPRMARTVLGAIDNGCVSETVMAISAVEKEGIFRFIGYKQDEKGNKISRNPELQRRQDDFRARYASDWDLYLEALRGFISAPNKEEYCEQYGFDKEVLERSQKRYFGVIEELRREGVTISSSDDPNAFTRALLVGYAPEYLLLKEDAYVRYQRLDRGDSRVRITGSSVACNDFPRLAVAMQFSPGRGQEFRGRKRGLVDTEFKYAVCVHPVGSQTLFEAMPHRVERLDGYPKRYRMVNGAVETLFGYRYKDRKGYSKNLPEDFACDKNEGAVRYFAQQVIKGGLEGDVCEDLFHLSKNEEMAKVLQNAFHRSRGEVSWTNLEDWYVGRLGDCISLEGARWKGRGNFHLKVEEFCDADFLSRMNVGAPETVQIGESSFPVEYAYRPEDMTRWSEKDRSERFSAMVDVLGSNDRATYVSVLQIAKRDADSVRKNIPSLREGDEVFWRTTLFGEKIEANSIETFQMQVEEKYFKKIFREWQQPDGVEVRMSLDSEIPTSENAGIPPTPFGKDYDNEDVFAYPAFTLHSRGVTQYYGQETKESDWTLRSQYFRTRELADAAQKKVADQYAEELRKKQRRLDRETMLESTKARFGRLVEDRLKNMGNTYAGSGLTHEDYTRVYGMWQTIADTLQSTDADPRYAMEQMDAIEQEFALGEERRAAVERSLGAMREDIGRVREFMGTLTRLNYSVYGMDYDVYNDVVRRWRGMRNEIDNFERRVAMLDPDEIRASMSELADRLPDKKYLTELQQNLFKLISENRYAPVLSIRGGMFRGSVQANAPRGELDVNPEIRASYSATARDIFAQRNKVTVYNSFNFPIGSWELPDGRYVFSADGQRAISVEEDEKAPFGWFALEEIPVQTTEEWVDRSAIFEQQQRARERAERAETVTSHTESVASDAIAEAMKAAKEGGVKKAKDVRPPVVRNHERRSGPERVVEMTDALREGLGGLLDDAEALVDWASEQKFEVPKVGATKGDRAKGEEMEKVRRRARELRGQLSDVRTIVLGTDHARATSAVAKYGSDAEALAKRVARVLEDRGDWTHRFKELMRGVPDLAESLGAKLGADSMKQVRLAVLDLAREVEAKRIPGENVSGRLEEIIIESLG